MTIKAIAPISKIFEKINDVPFRENAEDISQITTQMAIPNNKAPPFLPLKNLKAKKNKRDSAIISIASKTVKFKKADFILSKNADKSTPEFDTEVSSKVFIFTS